VPWNGAPGSWNPEPRQEEELAHRRADEETRSISARWRNLLAPLVEFYRKFLDEATRLGATAVGLNLKGGQQEFYNQMRAFLSEVEQ
jgi:hypothetical protein